MNNKMEVPRHLLIIPIRQSWYPFLKFFFQRRSLAPSQLSKRSPDNSPCTKAFTPPVKKRTCGSLSLRKPLTTVENADTPVSKLPMTKDQISEHVRFLQKKLSNLERVKKKCIGYFTKKKKYSSFSIKTSSYSILIEIINTSSICKQHFISFFFFNIT